MFVFPQPSFYSARACVFLGRLCHPYIVKQWVYFLVILHVPSHLSTLIIYRMLCSLDTPEVVVDVKKCFLIFLSVCFLIRPCLPYTTKQSEYFRVFLCVPCQLTTLIMYRIVCSLDPMWDVWDLQ